MCYLSGSFMVFSQLEEKIDRAHWMIYESDVRALLSPKFNGNAYFIISSKFIL